MFRRHSKHQRMIMVLLGWCFIVANVLGCGGMSQWARQNRLERLTAGMDETTVRRIAGEPDQRREFAPGKFVLYYHNPDASGTDPNKPGFYIPISFEDDKLLAMGQDLHKAWRQQDAEMKAVAQASAPEVPLDSVHNRVSRILSKERREKIDALERVVRPIPVGATALNLQLYRDLLALDPGNKRYQKKVAYYDWRLREKKQRLAPQARQENNRDENTGLRDFSGNDQLQMAVHVVDGASLYLWIKNIGNRSVKLLPDGFSLMDRRNVAVLCSPGKDLITIVDPGEIAHGRFYFQSGADLGKIIYSNPGTGVIVRYFSR